MTSKLTKAELAHVLKKGRQLKKQFKVLLNKKSEGKLNNTELQRFNELSKSHPQWINNTESTTKKTENVKLIKGFIQTEINDVIKDYVKKTNNKKLEAIRISRANIQYYIDKKLKPIVKTHFHSYIKNLTARHGANLLPKDMQIDENTSDKVKRDIELAQKKLAQKKKLFAKLNPTKKVINSEKN